MDGNGCFQSAPQDSAQVIPKFQGTGKPHDNGPVPDAHWLVLQMLGEKKAESWLPVSVGQSQLSGI